MPSARYRELARRVTKLRHHFLPAAFSATGSYTERDLDRARGFRLLAHAEIEAYLEDRARTIVNTAFKNWKSDRKPREVILKLLTFHLEQKSVSQQELKEEHAGRRQRLDEAIQSTTNAYNRILSHNHGIKEESVLKILLPLGVKHTDIDSTWLGTVDSFGSARGETAHSAVKAQQPLDPQTEFATISSILHGLEDLDKVLSKIKT